MTNEETFDGEWNICNAGSIAVLEHRDTRFCDFHAATTTGAADVTINDVELNKSTILYEGAHNFTF